MRNERAITLLAVSLAGLLVAGCDERPLKVGVANWKPQSTSGPIETRPLPPAQQVHLNYQLWLESETAAKVRLYEVVLADAANQVNYSVNIQRGDTPLGAGDETFVEFNYRDPTNGTYKLEWSMRGKHRPNFLKLDGHPKKVWLRLFGAPGESAHPRLQIVAIEGVESRASLVAEPGRKPQ
jgi:hypothetical protein